MATQPEVRHTLVRRNLLRPIGRIILVIGLVGVGYWAVLAFDASYSGKVPEDSIASDVANIYTIPKPGVEDPVDDSDLIWVVEDRDGNVIWEGPSEEAWVEFIGDPEAEYQADLRRTWLYPSAAVLLIGLLLITFSRRRTTTEVGQR